jgi:hypothetical protein
MAGGGGREVEELCPIQGIWLVGQGVYSPPLRGITSEGRNKTQKKEVASFVGYFWWNIFYISKYLSYHSAWSLE